MSTRTVSMSREETPAIALALQGGGGLGAYHIGAYEALAEARLLPDWVCGISIGAFNAAVIAGNPPEHRVAKLVGFWDAISWPDVPLPAHALQLRYWHNTASYANALLFGQPDFFIPRNPLSLLAPSAPPQETSFYDTTPMLSTLRRFAEFPIHGKTAVRLSLGATDIETGNVHYFDSTRDDIGPAHVLASGSLPPGFPATRVDSKLYWDGACVSNTPLDEIVDQSNHGHLVVFLIDLWNAAGKPPRNMNEVLWRTKQIEYASRTDYHLKSVATKVQLRQAMQSLKVTISGRTLIRSAISDTLKSFVIVECWSTRRQPFREASMGFLLHPRLERDPRRMRQGRIAKRYSGSGRIRESGAGSAWAGRERHTRRIGRADAERAGRRH
jgi:NTE family protein